MKDFLVTLLMRVFTVLMLVGGAYTMYITATSPTTHSDAPYQPAYRGIE